MSEATEPSAVAPASIESRVAAMMSGEPKPKAPQAAEPKEPPAAEVQSGDAETPAEAPAGDEPALEVNLAETPADVLEIIHNGQPQKLTKEQAKDLAEKGFDYTQKAQRLAENARAVQQLADAVRAQAQIQPQIMDARAMAKAAEMELAAYQNVDWERLAIDDPIGYAPHRAKFDRILSQWQGAKAAESQLTQQFDAKAQEARTEQFRIQAQQAIQAVPAWKDAAAYERDKQAIVGYLSQVGLFTQEDIATIQDPRILVVLRDAASYRALQKNGTLKKVEGLSPVAKPGTVQTRVEQRAQADQNLNRQIKTAKNERDREKLLTQKFMQKL